jgi:glycerol-3-phosphate dehydrogenase (NAD(P)+)
MKVGVIGAGAWGSALAMVAARPYFTTDTIKSGCNDVVLWSFDGVTMFDLPTNVTVTRDMRDLQCADVWLVATPSEFFRETIISAREFYDGQVIIICTKGIEQGTHKLMSEIIAEEMPELVDVGVLAGPQFAAEVANGLPTGTTCAGNPSVWAEVGFALPELYIETTDDIIGAQICGVGKNAVAVIMGYVAGRGENEKAMILTRAWSEVVKIGIARGAKLETFLMLCGIGDLFLTATSTTSRNYSAGMNIASGRPPMAQANGGTVEGIAALRGLGHMADEFGIDAPVLKSLDI